ncbi:MAG: mycothiol-dependent nitroreductase Rv2466c family protein [Marmoricola sp.]
MTADLDFYFDAVCPFAWMTSTSWDDVIERESDRALALTGKDVGAPIIHVGPPDGVAFFGPVISRRPSEEQAVELWEHVVGLARFPGFAELVRGLRETPKLRGLGVEVEEAQQDA